MTRAGSGPGGRRRAVPGRLALLVVLLLAWALPAGTLRAAADLPLLTGRVVDEAGLLTPASRAALESKLRSLEDRSGIQLVVATVRSLGGEELEPYTNRLFRAWKLGEAKKNNGVLLLVAPTEHRVRIEPGYGLEGTLTDAMSKTIISHALSPRFKAGDFQGGIESGVDDIIAVLTTDSAEWSKRVKPAPADRDAGGTLLIMFLFVIGFVVLVLYLRRNAPRGRAGPGGLVILPTVLPSPTTSRSSGDGGSSSGDSGFSGGGGSSGGGGASGDW